MSELKSIEQVVPAEEKPYYSSGSMSGWAVEARLQGVRAEKLGDQIFDNRWQRVDFARVQYPQVGVPEPRHRGGILEQCGLHSYNAAQALRWWFHAQADAAAAGVFSLETRLVSHDITYKVEWKRVGDQENVGTWEASK